MQFYNEYQHKIESNLPKSRRKVGKTYGSISGALPFGENREPVRYESKLERDFVSRLLLDSNIHTPISQPTTFEYCDRSGRSYPYTPDYLIHYKSGPTFKKSLLVEVKPFSKIIENFYQWKPRFWETYSFCKEHGLEFRIYDEKRIYDQKLDSVKTLMRYKKFRFPEAELTWILKELEMLQPCPFNFLLNHLFNNKNARATGISMIWHLASTKRIQLDLYQKLSPSTELWIDTYDH